MPAPAALQGVGRSSYLQCYQEGLTEHPWSGFPTSILWGLLPITPSRKGSVITLAPRTRCLQQRVVTAGSPGTQRGTLPADSSCSDHADQWELQPS